MPDSILENVHQNEAITVVAVRALKLDAANVQQFKQELSRLEIASHILLFDLAEVEFLDSAGLGALMSALRQANSRGGDIALCGLSASARYVVEIVRMHKIVEVYNDRAGALRAIAG